MASASICTNDKAAGGGGAAADAAAVVDESATDAAVTKGMLAPVKTENEDGTPSCVLLIHNVSKKQNIGNITRSAVAFGVSDLVVVGKGHTSTFGAMGTHRFLKPKRVPKLDLAVQELKEKGFRICGIEIHPQAKDVSTHPWTGPTVMMMGNEGQGMTEQQMALCDDFVYIQQMGKGTASLNVMVATSIVLHHYSMWAGFRERQRDPDKPHKFHVGKPPSWEVEKDGPEAKAKREARAKRRRLAAEGQAGE